MVRFDISFKGLVLHFGRGTLAHSGMELVAFVQDTVKIVTS